MHAPLFKNLRGYMYCLRGIAPGKFTLDSVRPNNSNGMLGVKGLIQSFILTVTDGVLE